MMILYTVHFYKHNFVPDNSLDLLKTNKKGFDNTRIYWRYIGHCKLSSIANANKSFTHTHQKQKTAFWKISFQWHLYTIL